MWNCNTQSLRNHGHAIRVPWISKTIPTILHGFARFLTMSCLSHLSFDLKIYYVTTGSRILLQRPVAKFFLQPHLFQTMSLFPNDCTWWLNIHCVELLMIQKTSSKNAYRRNLNVEIPIPCGTLRSYWNLVSKCHDFSSSKFASINVDCAKMLYWLQVLRNPPK